MKPYLSIFFVILCDILQAQHSKPFYDSTYIFASGRPQELIGQQVMLLDANVNNGLPVSMMLFTKEDGELKPLDFRQSEPLIGNVYTITKMEAIMWYKERRTLYTMVDSMGVTLWYTLNVNGEISLFTPIIPVGFLKKAEQLYSGKKVKTVWDSSVGSRKILQVENTVYEFLRVELKRTNDYAGEHIKPYYVLKTGDHIIREVPVEKQRFLEIQPDSVKLGL